MLEWVWHSSIRPSESISDNCLSLRSPSYFLSWERDHPTSSANHQPILFIHNTHLTCFWERITGTDSGGSNKGIIDQVATSSANLRFLEWSTSCLSLSGVIRMDTCDSLLEISDNIAHLRSCQHKITLEHLNTSFYGENDEISEQTWSRIPLLAAYSVLSTYLYRSGAWKEEIFIFRSEIFTHGSKIWSSVRREWNIIRHFEESFHHFLEVIEVISERDWLVR